MDRDTKGAFIISLDFELFWGMRHVMDLEAYRSNIRGVREALPRILDLFAKYGIHATHATVGFILFADKDALVAESPELKPTYTDRRMDSYAHVAHIGPDEAADPDHYAATLIDRIKQVPHQELACHTFSHYFCLEPGQTTDQFGADIEAAARAARKRGMTMRSLVFPANQYSDEHLEVIRHHGFTAYRGNQRSWVHRPMARSAFFSPVKRMIRLLDNWLPMTGPNCHPWPGAEKSLPMNIPASHFLRPWNRYTSLFEGARLARITRSMDRAAHTGTLFHLWWHPHNFGLNIDRNMAFLEKVLEHFDHLRKTYGMQSLSMGEVVQTVAHNAG